MIDLFHLYPFYPSLKLKDRVVVITGASSGIGRELAFQFAAKGSRVVLAARTQLVLEQISHQIVQAGGSAFPVPTDVTKRPEVERLMQKTHDAFGRIDILINNAGVSPAVGPLMNVREEDVRTTLEVNLMGGIYGVWAAVPYMEKNGGEIVFVSSAVGKRGIPRSSAYCASKFAVQGLTESIRQELRSKNIRVITVCPPGVNTPFFVRNGRGDRRNFRLHPVDKISRMIVAACERETPEVLLTIDAKLLYYGNVLFPRFLDWITARVKGV